MYMKAHFICHPDFAKKEPINVFCKENDFTEDIEGSHPQSLKNKHILFRNTFLADDLSKTESAILKITADDYYKLYINGVFVSSGPAPSYPESYFYNEIDVLKYLKEGSNTVAVHTYYQGLINRVWVSADLRQCLYFDLSLDGRTVLVSDESWKCTYHSGYSACGIIGYKTQYAECYDSSSPEIGFQKEDFDDSSWGNAAIRENADYRMKKQPTKQLDFISVEPVILKKEKDRIFADFGQEAVGYLCASAQGKKGSTVILHFGEELSDDGTVRYNMRCNCLYEEKWILSGKCDTLAQYDYKAFRYAELIVPPDTDISDIKMLVRYYPYEQKAVYRTENKDLQKVLQLCLNTVKYGMQEGFVDCPSREKGAYLGDISIAGRAHAVATGDCTMIKKAVMQFCDTSKVCKGLLAVSSSSLMQEIADYSLQFASQLLWIYRTDGDIEFLRQTEPYATRVYEYFLKYQNENGLISDITDKWNLVDWPSNLRDGYDFPLTKPIGHGLHNVINAFWYGFIDALDEIYAVLGKKRITYHSKKVRRAYIHTFYCEKDRLFADSPLIEKEPHYSIHSNVLPLLFGITGDCDGAKESIVSLIKKKKLSAMGVYMAYFTLAALKKNGYDELCTELATDKDCWLKMIDQSATTTFEAWGKDDKWNCSLFHPWASGPVIIFAENTLPY